MSIGLLMKLIHYHFKSIDSTNTWAKKNAPTFDKKALTLVTASTQTAGRGRFKRSWHSPPDVNIYATFCFFLDPDRFDTGHVTQLLALTAARVLENIHFTPKLKWPNDIMLSDKKLGGILCESILSQESRCVICGIGLNVNMGIEALQTIDRPATSLIVERPEKYSVDEILHSLTKTFLDYLRLFLKQGFDPFFEEFLKRSYLKIGQKIKFHDDRRQYEGIFQGINRDGSIVLETQQGKFETFYGGEFLP